MLVAVLLLPGPWDARGAARPAEKPPLRELVALRDARSTTTARPDGSLVTRLSRQSVHWFDRETGVWRDIDTELGASAKPGVGWRSGSNRFAVELADRSGGALASFEARQGRMEVWLDGAVADKAGAQDGPNAVMFRGVESGVDVQYAVLPDGLKETIVLRDSSAPSSYAFRLKPESGVEWRAEEVGKGGLWRFFAGGEPEPAFSLLPPTVGDSAGAPVATSADGVPGLVNVVAGKASLEVEQQKDGSFVATVKLDEGWLRAPERVFPVVVDPTLYSEPDIADGWYETDANDAVQFDSMLRTGAWGSGQPTMMSVLSFGVASIPPGATVLDARLNAWLDNCFPGSCDPGNAGSIRLRRLTGPWQGHTWSDVTTLIDSTSLDTVDFPSGTTPTQTWQTWQSGALTDTVQAMVNGSVANGGFILDKSSGSTANGFAFRSSRWTDPQYAPYLDVTWVADGVQVDPASSVHSNGAELRWQHYPGGGTSAYVEAVLADDPAAYFRLDEGAGTTNVVDWSGNGVSATVQTPNGVVQGQQGPLADLDPATRFLGSPAGYVKVADNPAIRVNDTFTLEVWVKRSDLTARTMSLFNDFGASYELRLNDQNRIELRRQDTAVSIAQSTSTISDTSWHHVAATKQGGAVHLYADGVDVTGSVTNQTLVSSSQGLHLGQSDGLSFPFYGWLDEAAIYPAALAESRIDAHYAAAAVTMPGFVRYEIHRSPTAGFTPSASTLIATLTDGSSQSYRDTTARPSTTFSYRVVTVTDEGGGSSFTSNEVAAQLPAQGEATVEVQPGYISSSAKATHISSGSAASNYGESQYLVVGSAGSNKTRALLQFDMHAIPTGVTVTDAQLELKALQTVSAGAIEAHGVTASWTEGGATWNQRDNWAGLNWTTAGGDYEAGAAGSGSGGTGVHPESIPITDLVQAWVNGDKSYLGLIVRYGSENGTQPTLSFAADGFWRSITMRPKLVVTFEDGSTSNAPSVAISQPQTGALVKGTVTLKAGALDDGAIKQVEFFDGQTQIGATDTTAPFEVSWQTAGRGASSLTAKATDEAGNVTTSSAVAVTRANSAAPTVSVATNVSLPSVDVTATASDDVGVSRVEFYANGDRFASDSSAPFEATWDTLSDPAVRGYDGDWDIVARAFDADGNSTDSSPANVTVDNAVDFEASIETGGVPLELFYDPGAGTQLSYPIDVTITNLGVFHLDTASMKLRYRWHDASGTAATPAPADVTIPGASFGTSQSRDMQLALAPPTLPAGVDRARYRLQLDIYDQGRTQTFSSLGSRPFETWATVTRLTPDELGLERYQAYDDEELGGGVANHVNLANGNSVVEWTPFSGPGRGIDTVVRLTYNSREHGSVSPLGNNWSLAVSSLAPLGLPLDVHPNAADTAAGRTDKWVGFTDGDGTYHRFTGNTAGTYYTAPAGVHLYLKKTGSTGWELWKPDRIRFVFDADGYPVKVTDANGNELTFTLATPALGDDPYGLGKRVTTVTDAGGRDFTLTYWSKSDTPTVAMRGKLQRLTGHAGRSLELTYYEDGNLRSITEQGGPGDDGMPTRDRTVVFAYTNAAGSGPAIATLAGRQNPDPATVQSTQLFSVIDFKGQETQFEYATSGANTGRLVGRTNRLGGATNKTTFAYPTATSTTVTLPLAREWAYTFDSQARVTEITDPLDQQTQVEWTTAVPLNHVHRVTQPTGELTEYAYNPNGYRVSEKDELGNETTYTYDNGAVDANDVSGNWETGRAIGHISQLASVTKPRGNATAGNPDDYTWTFTYTQQPTDSTTGLVKTITDPLGNVTTNTWNANATLASQTLPANGDGITRTATFNTYDANGLPTKVTDADGGVAEATYRADGVPVLQRDPLHAAQAAPSDTDSLHHFYDAFGRERRSSTPKSTSFTPGLLIWQSQSYDANDNIVSGQAPHYGRGDGNDGARTATIVDALDRPSLQTGPREAADGGPTSVETEYDAAGRAVRVTKPRGVNTQPSGGAYEDDLVTETSYDLLDRPLSVTEYAVDGSGAVDTATTRVTKSCYDLAGDLRSTTAPKGAGDLSSCPDPAADPYVYSTAGYTTKFEYDAAHRLVKTTDPAGNTTETDYDENGQITSQTDELGKVITTAYDDRGDRVSLEQPYDTGRTITTKWEYDPLGNIEQLISPRAFDAAGGTGPFTAYTESYRYDALGRLVREDLPSNGVADPVGSYGSSVNTSNPAGFWRLAESSGTTAADSSGNGHTGTIAGSPALALAGGPIGGGLSVTPTFDGSNDSVDIPDSAALRPTAVTLEAWVKFGSTGQNKGIVTKEPTVAGSNGYGFRSRGTGEIWFVIGREGSSYNRAVATGAVQTASWMHLVGTYDSTTGAIALWVNGVLKDSHTVPANAITSTAPLRIGGLNSGNERFVGRIAEVAVYPSVLGSSVIQAHNDAGAPALPASYRHYGYDANGNQTLVTLPTTEADPANVGADAKTTVDYWDTGAPYATTDPAGQPVRFDYTAEGWQTSRVSEVVGQVGVLDLARSMSWSYYSDGLVRALLDDGGQRAAYAYDADGNLTSAVEGTGLVDVGQAPLPVQLSYDSLDRVTKVRTPKAGSSNWLASIFWYDLDGNRTTVETGQEETDNGTAQGDGRSVAFGYDANDRPIWQVDDFASPGTAGDDEQILYAYTDRDELASQTLQKGGSGAWVTEQSSARTYFDNGLLKTLLNKNAGAAMLEQHALSYVQGGVFVNGNRTSDVFQLKGPTSSASCYSATCTATWTYDARDRLVAEDTGAGVSTAFALDVVGNVTGETPSPGTAVTRTYSGLRLATQTTGSTTVRFLYDGYGNQDCKVKSSYQGTTCPASGSELLEDWSYDYKNRLSRYRSYNGSGGLVNSVSWTNDPLDRPVAETSTVSGSTTNYAFTYVGASDLLAQEVLSGATSATRKYGYDVSDRRATMTDNSNRYSYLFDPHGSVSLLVDYAGSNPVKASYGYTAYGSAVSGLTKTASGFNANVNAYRYTGKRLDTGSGTLDMGARRYALDSNRFLQYDQYHGALDNLGLSLDPLTQNRYALAAGNPVMYVETDGHYFVEGTDADGIGDGAPPKTPTAQVPISTPNASESTSAERQEDEKKKKKAVGATLIVVGSGLSALSAIHIQDCLDEVATFNGIPLVWARAACLHMLANASIGGGLIFVGGCTVLSVDGYGKICLPQEKRRNSGRAALKT